MRHRISGPKLPAPVYSSRRVNLWETSDIIQFLQEHHGHYGNESRTPATQAGLRWSEPAESTGPSWML